MTLDPTLVEWINQEAAALNREGTVAGSPRETEMLATWKRLRPEMFRRLGSLAPKLAFVLDLKRLQAFKQYIRAGWGPTDAEEQATREWCLLEPEEPEDHATPDEL